MIIALQALIFFRESLLNALDRILRPYYKRLSLSFIRSGAVSSDDECEEQVFSEFDDERGVIFYPPMYAQRYAAVIDCLMDERWCGKLEKVAELGYHDMSFIKYLQGVPGVKDIMGVDIENTLLHCSSEIFKIDITQRENPLKVTLFQGNAADPDYRLIGCDAVVSIEMIEHMIPHDLERLIHTIFGFIKPWVVVKGSRLATAFDLKYVAILFQGNAADPDYRLIGCDAVVSIEMIEHMIPHDLERLIHTIFGFIKPWVVVLTTPNGDFNVLFKNLEENGLRRMDHYFEWTREQFNDWCSNIILRYPQYTVSCKGIGPGPPSTEHVGCCSQLALFVAKDYHKQQDLNINSLALVTNTPIEDNICDIIESWEPVEADNTLCHANSFESYPEFYFSNKNSCVTLLMPSPTYSFESIELQDKTLQCDLDVEQGKNFLMFDDEMYRVLIPRKNCHNMVYEIEDVFSRLNCTTLQVKKFSKVTQNLMAQHKDSLATREVMQEILNLTKMLNLNKGSVSESTKENIWCNINWGDNAPYWNQYYKVIREYNHPFEDKCEDIRILDLISDEINRLFDNEFDEESFVNADKVEVPIEYLMRIVEHITDDVDKVKELLEWNGYEVVDNIVIHLRLAIDKISNDSKDYDWNENDSLSDSYIDRTDLHCKTIADGTTLDMDHNARHLHRALDCKVRKIRKMLSADEDITTEINKVMRRLMKLALNNSENCSNPPPTQWIHRKLLELLTLTEKAIVQRQRNFERYPLKAIDFVHKVRLEDIATIDKICKDHTGKTVVDRYSDVISEDQKEEYDVKCYLESDFEDNVSVPLQLIKSDQIIDKVYWPNLHIIDETFLIIERNQVWEEDNEIYSFLNNNNFEHVGDTDYTVSKTDKNNFIEGQSDLYENIQDKEIPKSLLKLSNPELNVRKNSEDDECILHSQFNYNSPIENKFLSNIAATEENFLIDIIMDDRQETIALRRSIGTDVVDDQETLVRSISGHIKLNSINGEKETINVRLQSQTLFLDDINEPSTSRGICHNSINMQCGPDTVRDFSVLSTTTSFHEIPKLNSLIGVEEYENSSALETFSNDNESFNRILIPRIKSVGIHIRDSETKISDMSNNLHAFVSHTRNLATLDETRTLSLQYKETLNSQNVLDNDDDQKKSLNILENGQILEINKQSENRIGSDTNYCTPTIQTDVIDKHMEMQAETTLLKPASSDFKSVDSISDFNASIDSRKTPSRSFLFRIPSSLRLQTSISKDVQKFNSNRTRLHLSCGGVHVHSYNNKKVSEDVIYHGEWKKYIPKVKKTAQSRPVLRRGIETKHKNIKTDCEKITTAFSLQKEIKAMNRKLKLDIYKNTKQTSSTKKVTHLPIVNKPKVTSKIKMSIVSSKTKISHKVKNPFTETPKEIENNRNFIIDSYIPPYLKRNLEKMKQSKLKDVTQNLNEIRTIIKVNKQQKITCDKSCKNKMEIRKELLKLDISPRKNKSYLVFCNETRNKNDPFIVKSEINSTSIVQNNMDSSNKHFNTLSQNSSTCSSPNSVATVKLAAKRPKSCKKSVSICENTIENNLLVNTTTVNKKIITGIKNNNIGIDNDFNDKENVPQTPGQFYKNVERKSMNSFIRKHQSVYVAEIKKGSSSTINSLSKHNTLNKSNVKIPAIDSSYTVLKAVTASSTPQKSSISSELLINENKEQNSKSHNSNMVLRAETQILKENLSTNNIETAIVKECYNVLKSRLECFDNKITTSRQNVATEMQHLVYDILKHVEISYNENNAFDSETVILSREDISPEDSLASSYKTVIPADYINTMIDSSFKNSLNHTLDSTVGNESIISLPDTTLTTTDFDSFSCKSISDSRFSEYFLADNELSSSYQDSLRDIFERKDKMSSVNSPGALAVQIFSGFSLDAEPIAGDRPDSINLIDSETGSAVVETQRHATSEEILVSGRSSESYESCVLDEDSVVPDWLFRIISYQQHIDEDEEGNEFMIPEPLIDPSDPNNVEVEPVLGVGAGDGRGMHSDNSQDSSGRGTSLSSTDSSSGQQSEITLINPFTGQVELLSESVDSAVVNPCVPGTMSTDNALGSSEGASESNTHRGSSGSPTLLATSDFDADISSLETDVLDSSDN